MPKLKKKIIIHKKCGTRRVDKGRYARINHKTHLCFACRVFFTDKEKGVGV